MKMITREIETELKKRLRYPYIWNRKQNDTWDSYTNFIYQTPKWEELILKIEAKVLEHQLDKKELFYYAINRWYNFWSAMAIENIFSNCKEIITNPNFNSRTIDFTLQKIAFDHKTSVFPKHLNNDLAYAQSNKRELITWLYKNQSSQKRHHLKNRVFIIVFDKNGEHWKLKAEIKWMAKEIKNYVSNFKPSQLQKFIFTSQSETYSDIIWLTR